MRARLFITLAVVSLLGFSAPDARATSTTFISATADCYVSRLLVDSISGCPTETKGVTGYASATAVSDLSAQTFDVAATVRSAPSWITTNSARSQLDLVSGVASSAGGRVRIVLTNVTGSTSRYCVRLCEQLGHAYGYLEVIVQLRLKDKASEWPYVFCSLAGSPFTDTTTLPSTVVIPDDCTNRQGQLIAPANSTFDMLMHVVTIADARGAARAQARFAGRVSDIQVP